MAQVGFTKTRFISALIGGCAVAQVFVAPANAGPLEKNPVVAAPAGPFDWSGFYIGGNLGANWTNYDFGGYHTRVNLTEQFFQFEGPMLAQPQGESKSSPLEPIGGSAFLFFNTPSDLNHNGDGNDVAPTGGGQIGFNKQFGHIVVGVEGAFNGVSNPSNWTRSRDFKSSDFFFDSISAETTETTMRKAETRWNGAVMGKIGFATGPFLFYGIGGVAFTDVTAFADDRANTDFFGFGQPMRPQPEGDGGRFLGSFVSRNKTSDEHVMVGWTAGTGVEYAITQICSMGVEYRHNGFASHTFHFAANQGPISPGNSSVDTDSDQLTFKINFYLGHLGH